MSIYNYIIPIIFVTIIKFVIYVSLVKSALNCREKILKCVCDHTIIINRRGKSVHAVQPLNTEVFRLDKSI